MLKIFTRLSQLLSPLGMGLVPTYSKSRDRLTIFKRPNAVGLLTALAFLLLGAASQVEAQDRTFKNLPVLEARTDVNGVDMIGGGYILKSPFQFNAPGAGHLNTQTSFNGRRLSFSLNIYLDDQTHTRWDTGNPAERHIRVHLGGVDKLFTCFASGPCTQIVQNDGAVLNRISTHKYVLTDSDGSTYSFFDLAYQPLPVCSELGCNNAGYNAYAYVSSIVYPNGEKLTYDPYTVKQTGAGYRAADTIRSNLGYRIVLSRMVSANYAPSAAPGTNWLFYRPGGQFETLITLYSGQVDVGSIATNITYSNESLDAILSQSDALGRQYSAVFHADKVSSCAYPVDYTFLTPRVINRPGADQIIVTYKNLSGDNGNLNHGYTNVPVTSVSRGGRTWLYDITVGATRHVTTPLAGTQTFTLVGVADGYDYEENPCGSGGAVSSKIGEVEDQLGRKTQYSYNLANFGKPVAMAAPENDGYRYDYDTRGNLLAITRLPKPGFGSPETAVYAASFDSLCANPVKCNKPNWAKDAGGVQSGAQTDYVYDTTHGGLISETLPAGANGVRPQTRYSYSSFDTGDGIIYRLSQSSTCALGAAPTCIGTPDETRTTYAYTSSNLQPTSVTVAAGDGSLSATTTKVYDSVGNVVTVDGPLPGTADTTAYRYDALHRQIGDVGPAFVNGSGQTRHKAKRMTYHLNGQVEQVEEGLMAGQSEADWAGFVVLAKTVNTFDDGERMIKASRFGPSAGPYAVTQISYDAEDRKICTTVRMNADVFGALPSDACVLSMAGPDGPDRAMRNTYDAAGQLTQVVSGYGTASPRVEKTASYTANGREQTVADGNGNTTTYEYDGLDRLSKVRYPNPTCCASSTSDYETYAYDAAGNRTTWRKRSGDTVTSYFDALNRITYHDGVQTWFYYDNLGRPTTTYAGIAGVATKTTVRSYDAFGRVTYDEAYLSGAPLRMSSRYDAAGRRTRLTWPDGFYVTYDYDSAGAVTAIKESGTSNLATYSYDDLGRRTAVSLGNGANTQYAYDAASRLSALSLYLPDPSKRQTYDFTYNAAGQVTSRTASNSLYEWSETQGSRIYSVNGLNQYTAIGGGATSHDARGNMTTNGGKGFGYDLDNRLISTSSGETLSYDPLGRLQETTALNQQTKRLAYDGSNLVTEYDTANAILSRYVPGPGIDEPVVWYEGSGTSDRRFLMRDAQGSVISLSNNAGVSIATNVYDEYGNPPAVANTGRFQYTGQIWLPEVGVYHYKARAYSPSLGRFLQTDPIGYADGLNWYAYVGNDPMNRSDPTGLETCANPPSCTRSYIDSKPAGDRGPTISFKNDNPNGASPNQPVTTSAAIMVEQAVVKSGVKSININSTTGGAHAATSNHAKGRAIDINNVNGVSVRAQGASPAVSALQGAFADSSNIRENFGPSKMEKTALPGGAAAPFGTPKLRQDHEGHIHVSVQP